MPKYEFKQVASSTPGYSCVSMRKSGAKQWSKLTGVFGTHAEIRGLIRSWKLSQQLNLSALEKKWARAEALAEKATAEANKLHAEYEKAEALVEAVKRTTKPTMAA